MTEYLEHKIIEHGKKLFGKNLREEEISGLDLLKSAGKLLTPVYGDKLLIKSVK